jgi:predicted CXXCH cytochrome family protein
MRFLISTTIVAIACVTAGSLSIAAQGVEGTVTFHKDVLPILQKNCQTCHRPGQSAPMSLLTYEAARPWARAIKQAVSTRKMPPWFVSPDTSHHAKNDRSLKQPDIETLV